MKNKILFITKNYPPKIGGLEKFSYDLINVFSDHIETYAITLAKPLIHLCWFLPYALIKALLLIKHKDIPHVHLCDASLSPLGIILKKMTNASVSTTAAGLDITYTNIFYQSLIPHCAAKLDKVIPISQATGAECAKRNIPSGKMAVIPIGVNSEEITLGQPREQLRSELAQICKQPLEDKVILTTIGRLVERKGVRWFTGHVLPKLGPRFHYIIAGDGPDYERTSRLIDDLHLQNTTTFLGKVTDETKKILLNGADMFIMPNISVPGDVEGFGIVAIEAAACGTPVVAADIQGIRDAVIDGVTGFLVEERNVSAFIKAIGEGTSLDREMIRKKVIDTYNWETIYKTYHRLFFRNNYEHQHQK